MVSWLSASELRKAALLDRCAAIVAETVDHAVIMVAAAVMDAAPVAEAVVADAVAAVVVAAADVAAAEIAATGSFNPNSKHTKGTETFRALCYMYAIRLCN